MPSLEGTSEEVLFSDSKKLSAKKVKAWRFGNLEEGENALMKNLTVLVRVMSVALIILTLLWPLGRALGDERSQATETSGWRTVANGDYVHRLLRIGDTLWESSLGGGVVKWDLRMGSYTQYLFPQDGLGNNWVYDVAQDLDGNIWAAHLGIETGLSEFSEGRWQVHPPVVNSSRRSQAVHVDEKNRVLIGTVAEVLRYDQQSGTWETLYPDFGFAEWMDVTTDSEGNVWAGSYFDGGLQSPSPYSGNNLVRISPDGSVAAFNTSSDHQAPGINFLNIAPDGRLWVSSYNHLAVSRSRVPDVKGFDIYEGEFSGAEIGDIRWTKEGDAWIGTSLGLFLWEKGEKKPRLQVSAQSLRVPDAKAIEFDDEGKKIFVGSMGEGIKIYDIATGAVSGELRTKGLRGSTTCGITDPWGNLWIGTRGQGLNVVSPEGEWLYLKEGLISPYVISLAVKQTSSRSYTLAVGTGWGLSLVKVKRPLIQFSKKQPQPFLAWGKPRNLDTKSLGLHDDVLALDFAKDGKLWFSTPKGIGLVNDLNTRIWPVDDWSFGNAMKVNNDGEVEVGSSEGVMVFNSTTELWRRKEGLPEGRVMAIALNGDETWYAVRGSGLYTLRGGNIFRSFSRSENPYSGVAYSWGIGIFKDLVFSADDSFGLEVLNPDGSWSAVPDYCHYKATWVLADKFGRVFAGGDSRTMPLPCPAYSIFTP